MTYNNDDLKGAMPKHCNTKVKIVVLFVSVGAWKSFDTSNRPC